MSHPKFKYQLPPLEGEKWGFLRESRYSKDIAGKDAATGLHRNGLDEYLAVIFPKKEFIHDKTIPGLRFRLRPDYRCDELKLLVEFDGLQHYTSPQKIEDDVRKTKFYEESGYKVVRIPYFIQLTNEAVKTLFGVEVPEKLFNARFPSLSGRATPACLCPAGIERMAAEFARFPDQYVINVEFLESWDRTDNIVNGVRLLKRAYQAINGFEVVVF